MKAFDLVIPFASVALLVVLAALPWGLPTQDRFFLPLLPIIAIHYWALRRRSALPEWAVFCAGFLLDVLTHGPLGYWPLMYLAAYILGVLGQPLGGGRAYVRVILFVLTLGIVTALAWGAACIYFVERVDAGPYVRGAALALVASSIILPLLHLLASPPQGVRPDPSLTRGG